MKEEFRPVVGYEGIYEVSNLGRVKAVERTFYHPRTKTTTRKESMMSPNPNSGGYPHLNLRKDGVAKNRMVHRLVAMAFLNNPDNLPEVNHIDGNKKNNRVDNLEWCSKSHNVRHAYETGLNKIPSGKDSPLFKGVIKATCIKTGSTKALMGKRSIRENGFQPRWVYACVNGKKADHKGYTFERIPV